MAELLIELLIKGVAWAAPHAAEMTAGVSLVKWFAVVSVVLLAFFFPRETLRAVRFVGRQVFENPVRVLRYTVGAIAAVLLCSLPFGVHQVTQGNVGLYWRGGELLGAMAEPGYHYRLPFWTRTAQVAVSIRTDVVRDVPCGTAGGIMIAFAKIEVVFRLERQSVIETVRNYTEHYHQPMIHDQVHHHINEYCSQKELKQIYIDEFDQIDENLAEALRGSVKTWAPGIRFLSVRVTKPTIPDGIGRLYQKLGGMATTLKVLEQKTKTMAKVERGKLARALQEAEKRRAISIIDARKRVDRQEARVLIEAIEDEITLKRQRDGADSALYTTLREAESDAYRLTPQFLLLQQATAGVANTRYYFGDSVPDYIVSDPDDPVTQLMAPSGWGEKNGL